ncbi:aldehyde ferredoxin oxidoreductase family protein [Halomarina litorea]|uniref:aldehyde ferredoxin oxidoreductase family protein n=1 Tax=Halomarina litorea TaxID=2961595 RepID=UPI0020C48FE7|nr:aldehyde ferredoxin oxidoreductase C-terminal domain-containing protein [Halomarina sp. BCD28]
MIHDEGSLLTVDLGDRTTTETDIDAVLEQFIGGRGVATALAHDRVPFDADPFGPENRLYFTTGPLQASQTSFTGRTNATAVSPLTGGLLSSNAGGFVSRNLKATGHAAVEIVGECDELVGLHVTDEGVEFEAVPDLDGALTSEVTEHVRETRDLDAENVVCIGPAGENRVRFACLMTTETRAFGRGGLGAVLGAKNVKFVTFDGDSAPELELPGDGASLHRDAATSDSVMKRQGTTSVTELANEVGALPTRYFAETTFEAAANIGGDAVEAKKYKKGTCSQCAFACKLPTRDEERGIETEGPEYETVMSFGSNAGVDDIVDVMQSNELCDEFGMDTISCGDTVSAYLAAEGEFGNVDLITETISKIAHREGIGDVLAEGVHRAHEQLGVEDWSVKGMEFSAHDGRTLNGQGLGFAVSNRGADHMYSTFYAYEYPLVAPDEAFDASGLTGKPEKLVELENKRALEDCGVLCRFSRGEMSEARFEEFFGADFGDLLDVGARVVELERHFNNERGFDRSDDTLPYDLPEFEAALDEYYEARGWNDDGTVPDSGGAGAAPADD